MAEQAVRYEIAMPVAYGTPAEQETHFAWDNGERVLRAWTGNPRVARRWLRAGFAVIVLSRTRPDAEAPEGRCRSFAVDVPVSGGPGPWRKLWRVSVPSRPWYGPGAVADADEDADSMSPTTARADISEGT